VLHNDKSGPGSGVTTLLLLLLLFQEELGIMENLEYDYELLRESE
jgi:hypothetical protein